MVPPGVVATGSDPLSAGGCARPESQSLPGGTFQDRGDDYRTSRCERTPASRFTRW